MGRVTCDARYRVRNFSRKSNIQTKNVLVAKKIRSRVKVNPIQLLSEVTRNLVFKYWLSIAGSSNFVFFAVHLFDCVTDRVCSKVELTHSNVL